MGSTASTTTTKNVSAENASMVSGGDSTDDDHGSDMSLMSTEIPGIPGGDASMLSGGGGDMSSMSTALPRGHVVNSFDDLQTQYQLPTDTTHPVVAMEYLWKRMTPQERHRAMQH